MNPDRLSLRGTELNPRCHITQTLESNYFVGEENLVSKPPKLKILVIEPHLFWRYHDILHDPIHPNLIADTRGSPIRQP